jgi:hypothetical protein
MSPLPVGASGQEYPDFETIDFFDFQTPSILLASASELGKIGV